MRAIRFLFVLLVAVAMPVWGGQLALYIFNGTADVPVNSTAPGLGASDLTQHGLTLGSSDPLFFSSNDWPVNAYSGTSYYQWTLTPGAGMFVDYSSVTFDYTIGTNPAFTFEILTSVDGFTTPLSGHTDPVGGATYSDSMAALGVQSGPVTFRLFGQVDSISGQSGFYGGNMSFNGPATAIFGPEPSTFFLAAGAGLALLARLKSRG